MLDEWEMLVWGITPSQTHKDNVNKHKRFFESQGYQVLKVSIIGASTLGGVS